MLTREDPAPLRSRAIRRLVQLSFQQSQDGETIAHFDARTGQIVKVRIHQTTQTPSKPCFAMFKASFVQI